MACKLWLFHAAMAGKRGAARLVLGIGGRAALGIGASAA